MIILQHRLMKKQPIPQSNHQELQLAQTSKLRPRNNLIMHRLTWLQQTRVKNWFRGKILPSKRSQYNSKHLHLHLRQLHQKSQKQLRNKRHQHHSLQLQQQRQKLMWQLTLKVSAQEKRSSSIRRMWGTKASWSQLKKRTKPLKSTWRLKLQELQIKLWKKVLRPYSQKNLSNSRVNSSKQGKSQLICLAKEAL